jgi:hypothetical protein
MSDEFLASIEPIDREPHYQVCQQDTSIFRSVILALTVSHVCCWIQMVAKLSTGDWCSQVLQMWIRTSSSDIKADVF